MNDTTNDHEHPAPQPAGAEPTPPRNCFICGHALSGPTGSFCESCRRHRWE